MANPPVNPKQFKGHEQHLSALENQHRVEFTRQGLNYTGGFTPTSNVNSSGYEGRPGADFPVSTISLHIPTEDPDVSNNLHLFSPTSDKDHPASGVETVENHSYLNAETGEYEPRSRWNWHPDVPSAVDYMRECYQQRKQHLEDKTMPEPTGNGVTSFIQITKVYGVMTLSVITQRHRLRSKRVVLFPLALLHTRPKVVNLTILPPTR